MHGVKASRAKSSNGSNVPLLPSRALETSSMKSRKKGARIGYGSKSNKDRRRLLRSFERRVHRRNAQMRQLALAGLQPLFYLPQAMRTAQLAKQHRHKLLPAAHAARVSLGA